MTTSTSVERRRLHARRSLTRQHLIPTILVSALLLSSSLTTAANADSYLQSQGLVPPNKLIKSAGDVDVITGKVAREDTDLALGAGASSKLSLSRIAPAGIPGHANILGDVGSGLEIMLTEHKFNHCKGDPTMPGNDYRLGVRFGSASATFDATYSQYTYDPDHPYTCAGNGGYPISVSKDAAATLLASGSLDSSSTVYTYTAQDGLTAVFRPIGGGDCSAAERCAFVDQVIFPNGERWDFTYGASPASGGGAVVLTSVTSSLGYRMITENAAFNGQAVSLPLAL